MKNLLKTIFDWRSTLAVAWLICLSITAFSQDYQITDERRAEIKKQVEAASDEELIKIFTSQPKTQNFIDADPHSYLVEGATDEIFNRGERMLPLLVKLKGNNNFNWSFGLGRLYAVRAVITPTSKPETNDGSLLTNEVASLYLISGIYYGRLDFASRYYLDDGTCRKSWFGYNTSEKVEKAWIATEKWIKRLNKDGIELLRSQKINPLSDSGVNWNGDGGKNKSGLCEEVIKSLPYNTKDKKKQKQ